MERVTHFWMRRLNLIKSKCKGLDDLGVFYDPVLRAPTLGSALMSLTAALVGVVVFLRKASLVGEVSFACTYPGVILALVS